MSALPPVLGAASGMAAAWLLLPLTRRELAAAVARAAAPVALPARTSGGTHFHHYDGGPDDRDGGGRGADVRVTGPQRAVVVAVSGLLPAYVLAHVGWAAVALPPLVLLVGLVQLAYCDLTRRLLPKRLVHWLTAGVMASGAIVAACGHEWERLAVATLGALALGSLFFVVNLVNADWLAFGDVRLSPAVGFGLAWVSPIALLEGFLCANLLAAVVGAVLIGAGRAGRASAVPFGLYLAAGTALVLLGWS